jgi:hypothetical protein
MTEQTEALQLAEYLDMQHIGQHRSAAELRRLSRVNAELLEALKKAADHAYWPDIEKNIRAAIARAEE